jgi:RNA polymerase sigma-70 factor (ECF subfamily)
MQVEASALTVEEVTDPELSRREVSADRSLVVRAKAGETKAFDALLLRYQRQVLGTALRLLANRDDARDASQEVFLRLFRHLRTLDPDRALAPWLYRVTVNVCRDFGRRRKGRDFQVDVDWADVSAGAGPGAEDVDRRLILSEEWHVLQQALAALPEKERAAIVLRDIEDLETREVARILGTSEVTVRSQVSRARLRIRRHLERVLDRRRQ